MSKIEEEPATFGLLSCEYQDVQDQDTHALSSHENSQGTGDSKNESESDGKSDRGEGEDGDKEGGESALQGKAAALLSSINELFAVYIKVSLWEWEWGWEWGR